MILSLVAVSVVSVLSVFAVLSVSAVPASTAASTAASAVPAATAGATAEGSPASSPLPTGRLVEGMKCSVDPTQTYTLYLPSGYSPEGRWPALLIFDPRGRSVQAAEIFRAAAERYSWVILSSDNTRSDESMEPNARALNALWPEVHTRYSVDFQRIYAAGFSGGAMLGWALGQASGEIAGVIGSGGRLEPHNFDQKIDFPCFGAAGDTDFNYSEMRRAHRQLDRWGTPNRLEIFVGPHRWMPAELAREGVEWMELQAMKRGLRRRDDPLISELFQRDVERASRLASAGSSLSAQRRFAAIVSTYEGLRDVAEPRRQATRLEGSAEVAAARKIEKKWDAYEASYRQTMIAAFARLLAERPASARELGVALRLGELQGRAQSEGYAGVVARRVLETLLTQTSFYLNRDFFARQDYRSAAKVLTVASEIRPERADVWYNLACALAHTGSQKRALEALERAVVAGFADGEQLASDPDLETLRASETFQRLVARLGK